jgi:hypothetical protein
MKITCKEAGVGLCLDCKSNNEDNCWIIYWANKIKIIQNDKEKVKKMLIDYFSRGKCGYIEMAIIHYASQYIPLMNAIKLLK